jgi:zinc-binding alcohol dehydrogenase family protein
MHAVAYQQCLPVEADDALVDIQLEQPTPKPHDLLVEIKAISVNPVDTKIRTRVAPDAGQYKILGWDAAGIVRAVGDQVSQFKVGDAVFYAGDLTRAGTNAEFHLVDERLVGHKPRTLDFAQAAALPLTSITAWEALFDRLKITLSTASTSGTINGTIAPAASILIIGGAGGVGSMAIQLLRALTKLTIVATASRAESQEWCKQLGAHVVLDHSQSLTAQFEAQQLDTPQYVFSTTHTDQHLQAISEIIAPQGALVLIDDPKQLDISLLKRKSIAIHWEFMFTRSLFQTPDLQAQSQLLNRIAELVDQGQLQSTVNQSLGTINAVNLKKAHALLESHQSIGKVVLSGF